MIFIIIWIYDNVSRYSYVKYFTNVIFFHCSKFHKCKTFHCEVFHNWKFFHCAVFHILTFHFHCAEFHKCKFFHYHMNSCSYIHMIKFNWESLSFKWKRFYFEITVTFLILLHIIYIGHYFLFLTYVWWATAQLFILIFKLFLFWYSK